MEKHHNACKLNLDGRELTTRSLAWFGFALLSLCAVSILSMPVTQYLWSWDRFLHGGQDFESGVLMALTFFCLALVLSKQCKRNVIDSLISACRTIVRAGRNLLLVSPKIRAFAIFGDLLLSPFFAVCRTPLRI